MTRTIALLVALALPFTSAAQAIYKWVDDKGVTHYESAPPAESKAKKIDVKPAPPSSPHAADDPASWKDQARELELQRQAREAADGKSAAAAQQQEKRCRAARIQVDRLTRMQQLYRYDDKGERHYLSDDERTAELEQVKSFIARNC